MSKRTPLSGHIGFNAQHSPMGAFMSFTCGNLGTRGGLGLQIGQPADQELYIGVKDGDRYADATLKCLPFYVGAVSRAAILRLGASEEGTLRQHAVTATGRVRDTVYFSILSSEWPVVKARLEARLAAGETTT